MKPEFIVGPGDYDSNQVSIGKQAPKWTMLRKQSQSYTTDAPPVGLYDVQNAYNKTQRPNLKASLKSRKGMFLDSLKLNSISPGPCSYNNKLLTFGKTGKAATVRGKPRYRSLNRNPGPGTYDLKFIN